METIRKDLFDTNAALYVLSGLMKKPLLLQDERYAFCDSDFYKPLQKIIFSVIFNLGQQGMEHISSTDIDLYLKQYDSQYEYYKANKGYEFVVQCFQTSDDDVKQFDYYYNRLKKFSMLRDLQAIGYDTSSFYNTKEILNRDAEDEKLNKIDLQEIPERIRRRLIEIENRHIGKDNGSTKEAFQGLRKLVDDLKETPEVGLPIDGDIINSATRGARLGKLYTYSAPSGTGKTRYMLGNACAISMPYIDKTGKVVIRGEAATGGDYQKVLFITTEQQVDEIQTMLLAYVSGVNEKNILLGKYTKIEEEKINMALDIIDKYGSNFLIECIPDPSIAMLKAKLIKYIVQDEIEYIFYDYIFSSPGLLSEFKDVGVREDVALMMLSNTLKEIAANYNVFIQSATQLNDNWSKVKIGARDQNCIRGSKAIADKIDVGMIGIRIPDEERTQIETLWNEYCKQSAIKPEHEPNIVIDIYKNRRGDMSAVKVFRYFDLSTCRAQDLFVVDCSYKSINQPDKMNFLTERVDFLELKLGGVK